MPSAFKAQHDGIEWRQIAGAGIVYRHAYDAVTPRRIWETATTRLDSLRPSIAAEIAKLASR